MNEVKPGRYQHFKGKQYEVIGVARHSETLEEFVVYRALYESPKYGFGALWVRPKAMFLEEIEKEGYRGPRFRHVG